MLLLFAVVTGKSVAIVYPDEPAAKKAFTGLQRFIEDPPVRIEGRALWSE